MRIYTRREFLKLPEGTVYASGKEWYFEGPKIKGKTIWFDDIENDIHDFYEQDFNWVEGKDSGECFDRLADMLATGSSYPMQNSICRDGMFDPDDLFLVYEKADLEILKAYIEEAIELA
jgi:hypothetical protein